MTTTLPYVTVILPIRNEAFYISQSLGAILRQDYPKEKLEIIVADGMSSDKTRELIAQLLFDHPEIVAKVVDNPEIAVPSGFNTALSLARGEVIVRVDGHCVIQPDYLKRCVDLLCTTGADNVGGIQNAIGHSNIGRAIAKATSAKFGVGGARFHYATAGCWTDTVFLGAYKRSVFDRLGGFDIEMACNEDDEFNFRLVQNGGKIWLAPELRTTYYVRSTWSKLFRQYFRYGFYKVLVIQKRHGVASWRHLIPGLFVLFLCCSLVLGMVSGNLLLAFSILVPYLIVNTVVSALFFRNNLGQLLYLITAFCLLHMSYGIGFDLGLLYWPWKKLNCGFRKSISF